MRKVSNIFLSLGCSAASLCAMPTVGDIDIYSVDQSLLLGDTDIVMHGTDIRLEVSATPAAGETIERVEFFRYGSFIGEGALDTNGNWYLITEATAHTFSPSDEPSTVLIDEDKLNGSFEDWTGTMPDNWLRGNGGYNSQYGYIPLLPVTKVTTDAHTGNNSVKITGVQDATSPDGNYNMKNWSNVWLLNYIGMQTGSKYKVEFYAKRLNGLATDRLQVGKGYGPTFHDDLVYTETDGSWKHYELHPVEPSAVGSTYGRLVFTSRKGGTEWLIDSVKVTLTQDVQDIYYARVVEDSGDVATSDYAGVKTLPFSASINFQADTASVPDGYAADFGAFYGIQANGLSYGWLYEANNQLVDAPLASEPIQEHSIGFTVEDQIINQWELEVPPGEYLVTIHFPDSQSIPGSGYRYSLMVEDQAAINGFIEAGAPMDSAIQRVIVTDGRLTLSADAASDANLISAVDIIQLSASSDKSIFRRGHNTTNDFKSSVISLDGQPGLRTVDLDLIGDQSALRMHYSASSNEYTIYAADPVVSYGAEGGPSELLADISYDFGVSAGDVSASFNGYLPEDVASQSSAAVQALKGFYLVVKNRTDGSFIERIPLDLPDVDSADWVTLLTNGSCKKFTNSTYGLTTWIRPMTSSEWNYQGAPDYIEDLNYTFTHMADANSANYLFVIEAASSFHGEPAVRYAGGNYDGQATLNTLYEFSFDRGQPWRMQNFTLAHRGELAPSAYQGTDPRALSMTEEAFSSVEYHFLNAAGGSIGPALDMNLQSDVDTFESTFSTVDHAPEFRSHPVLDQLLLDYGSDPLALARYVFNEIEVIDYVGMHPGLSTSNIPVEVTLGGLRRDALAVLQEGAGSPREICILLTYLLRASGVPAAIAEPSDGHVYLLDTDYSRLIGQNIAGTALTPEKIPLEYPWVVAYIEGEAEPFKHLFPWIKETELTEGHDLYDLLPERFDNGFKYFDKYIRADDEVMRIGSDGLVDPLVRGYDDDQPYVLWPALIKDLLSENGSGVSYDEIGVRKHNRPQQYTDWWEFPRPFQITGSVALHDDYTVDPDNYDTVTYYLATSDNHDDTIDITNNLLWQSEPIPLMDLHNRSVNIDYSSGSITLSIAPYLPYSGPTTYNTSAYPTLGDVDYVSRSKLGYTYIVSHAGNSADFGVLEHRQRSYKTGMQQQQNRFFQYYGSQNFWNARYVSGNINVYDTFGGGAEGVLSMSARPISPGNYASVHNSGRVTDAMLRTHTSAIAYHERNVINQGLSEDATVTQHRLFTLLGLAYWQKTVDFELLAAAKHKVIMPTMGGTMFSGLNANGSGDLVFPFIDVANLVTSAYWGGHINLAHGHDSRTTFLDLYYLFSAQDSAYEHAVLRNLLGVEGEYSTVKVLQEASRRHRADPQNVPDIVLLSNGPNTNGNDWLQEGEVFYQGQKLKEWDAGLWGKVENLLDANSNLIHTSGLALGLPEHLRDDSFELAYISPGPVSINGVGRMGVATLQHSGGAGMYISSSSSPLNGGGSNELDGADEPGFLSRLASKVAAIINSTSSSEGVQHTPAPDGTTTTVWVGGQPVVELPVEEARELTNALSSLAPADAELVGMAYVGSRLAGDSPSEAFDHGLTVLANSPFSSQSIYASTSDSGALSVTVGEIPLFTDGANSLVGDPVNIIDGYFYIDTTDISLPGPFPLTLRRNYVSQNLADNQLGAGWKFGFMHYLQFIEENSDPEALIYAAEMDGSVLAYEKDLNNSDRWNVTISANPSLSNHSESGVGSLANRYGNYIERVGDRYTLYSNSGEVRIYDMDEYPIGGLVDRRRPYLQSWSDASGNNFAFSYIEDSDAFGYGDLYQIKSSNGNAVTFSYGDNHRPSMIATHDGRILRYYYDQFGDLRRVTLPDGYEIRYTYQLALDQNGDDISTHLLIREEKPLGRVLENDYDGDRRVLRQRATVGESNALIENASYAYHHTHASGDAATGYTLVTAVNGGVTRYDYTDGLITSITDAETNQIQKEWYADRLTFPDPAAAPDASRVIAETTVASLTEDEPGGFGRSLKRTKDKRGRVTYFWYDADGNIVQTKTIGEIDGDLSNGDEVATSTSTYNDKHLPTDLVDPVGNMTRIAYGDTDYPYMPTSIEQRDSSDALISRTERAYTEVETASASAFGLNSTVRQAVGTDDESFVLTEYSEHGFPLRVTQYTDEDDLNNVTSDPNVVLEYIYNIRGRLIQESDSSGARTTYQYDPMDRLTAVRAYDENDVLLSTNFNYYNAAGDLEWNDGPRTGVEDHTYRRYDGAGRLLQQLVWRSQASTDGTGVEAFPQYLDEAFAVEQYSYDGFGNLTGVIDPNGHEMRMSYDMIGRKLSQSSYEGAYADGAEPLSSLAWTYESGGKVHTSTNTLGGVTENLYTDLGALRSKQNPDGTISQFRYLLDGRITKEIYPSGNELRYAYDDLARTVTRTLHKNTGEQLSQTIQYFDRRGNPIQEIDAEGYVRQSTFDDLNRVVARSGPAGDGVGTEQQLSHASYDPNLRTVTITDASLQSVATTNDALGRAISTVVRDSQSNIVQETYFDYSTDHHSVTRTEGSGADAIQVTTWTNTQGQPVLIQHHLDTGGYDFERLAYDLSGNQTMTVDALGYQTERIYDGLNRMVANTRPDGATTEFRYIDQGEVIRRVMPGGLTHE
ncbi:MAG: DUF6531 domain-containing protein, partial [Verrucomicrobiota bacterium]